MNGCKEGGVSDKDCPCATQMVGTRYDLKNLQEFMNDRAIPMQILQMDFVKALAMCTAKPGVRCCDGAWGLWGERDWAVAWSLVPWLLFFRSEGIRRGLFGQCWLS